jgi:hypothetical protein
MKGEYQSCREAMGKLRDHKSKVRCQTCANRQKCIKDSLEFDKYDREMKSNKGVFVR